MSSIAARIEDASLGFAQPSQQSFYDGWLLRYSPGKARRARSINAIGAGVLPVEDKLAYCIDFYAGHSMQCLFRITPFSQPQELDHKLKAAGFEADQDTRVMRLDLLNAPRLATSPAVRAIDVDQFAQAFGRLHRLDAAKTDAERARYARSIDTTFVAQFEDEMPIACGSVAVEGAVAGIFGMVTAESHRGRGIASALVASLLEHARNAGAHTAYL
ncbi:MAG: GNAT family N-acetyltransferase, partial [Burkholderiaceae bacterium]